MDSKVSPGPAMPYPSMPCGRATPETAVFYLFGHRMLMGKFKEVSVKIRAVFLGVSTGSIKVSVGLITLYPAEGQPPAG
jgi:hypothetical protein